MFNRKLKAKLERSKELQALQLAKIDRLKDYLDWSQKAYDEVQSELRRAHEQIAKLQPKVVGEPKVQTISFSAYFHGRLVKTDFTLGLGPCGKTVRSLSVSGDDKLFVIHQVHTDGSSKDFEYLRSQIEGRVTIEKAVPELNLTLPTWSLM